MTDRIYTYDDLQEEKKRLQTLLEAQKELIRHDLAAIRHEFQPAINAASTVSKMFTRDGSNPLLNLGIDKTIDIVVKNLLLAKAGWIGKLVIPFIIKNYSSHALGENMDGIKKKLFSLFRKKHRQNGQSHVVNEPETEE
jgi:hypothetical protein